MKAGGMVWRCAVVLGVLGSMATLVYAGAVRPQVSSSPPSLLLPYPLPESPQCEKTTQPVLRAALFGVSDYPSLGDYYQLKSSVNNVHLISTALHNLGVKDIEVFSGNIKINSFAEKLQSMAKQSKCGDTLILYFDGHSMKSVSNDLPVILFSDMVERESKFGTLGSDELLAYFGWLREQGVNIFFILDAKLGQKMAGKMTYENEEGATLWRPFEPEINPAFERGAFFGIYVEESPYLKLPIGDPNSKLYGFLSYHVATALLTSKEADSFRVISASITQKFKSIGSNQKTGLTFEASHPNRSPLAVGLPGSGRGEVKLRGHEDRRIDITNPAPQRGAARISGETLLIEGKVVAPTRPIAIEANQTAGKVNPDGSFSVRLPVKRGENKVALVAWFSDSDFLPKPFTVVSSEGDQVIQEGKRYALIIANQDYRDPAYGKLETPFADAEALAERLEKKFDFKLKAQIGGQMVPLVLKNATKDEMERALSRLRKVITPSDSVMVFYAGHGIYEKQTDQAYWLPVDAEGDEPQTWLSAHDVQTAIQRLEARHVLVVADSCFSGGFRKRGVEAEDKSAMSRVQYLTNSMTRPSREFISSGDVEPVSDGGGRGHSTFARALLDALDQENKAFTTGELFQKHIKEAVSGRSGQSPQYFPMKEGHEGGEFVFLPVAVDGV